MPKFHVNPSNNNKIPIKLYEMTLSSSTRLDSNKLEICFIPSFSISVVDFDQGNLFSDKSKR